MTNEQIIFSENGVMCYYDFDSKEKGVLCSKPNCEHKPFDSTTNPDPVCNAVTDEGTEYTALIYSDGFVYAITDNTANSKLYKYDIKNDTKKMIAEFDFLVSGNAWLSDDKLIMQTYSLNFDETGLGDTNGSTYNFCIYDLKNNTSKFTDLAGGTFISTNYLDGNKIYYGSYIDNDKNVKVSTHCYDINTNRDTEVLKDNAIFLYDNGKGYYSVTEADETKMYMAELNGGKSKLIGNGYINQAFDDKLLYFDGKKYLVYNNETKESAECADISGAIERIDHKHTIYVNSDEELCFIPTDDFLKGKDTTEIISRGQQ